MSGDEPEGGSVGRKRRRVKLARLALRFGTLFESAVIVAIVVGVFAYLRDDGSQRVKLCEIATNYLMDDAKDAKSLPEAERIALARRYALMARANCEGME